MVSVHAHTDASMGAPALGRRVLLVVVKVRAFHGIWILLSVQRTRLLLERRHRRVSVGICAVRQRRAQVVCCRLRAEAARGRLVHDLLLQVKTLLVVGLHGVIGEALATEADL